MSEYKIIIDEITEDAPATTTTAAIPVKIAVRDDIRRKHLSSLKKRVVEGMRIADLVPSITPGQSIQEGAQNTYITPYLDWLNSTKGV